MSKPEEKLAAEIAQKLRTGRLSEAKLSTDERVLARITDGIYRQPASALRELIANAYDADATEVHIHTDAPRFSKISIRDNGDGLSVETLSRLVYHIGGSSKRTQEGVNLGIVNRTDKTLSPQGRRLIGKIGIGLFSVAQLTRHFLIITKTRDTNYRLVAEVLLKNYSEEEATKLTDGKRHDTGIVRIRSVRAEERNAHGTEIILQDLRPNTRELLQSAELWDASKAANESDQNRPRYHVGRLSPNTEDTGLIETPASLPWANGDLPEVRFQKFYQKILDAVATDAENPQLEKLLDYYLRMLWTLSLSAPLDYIEKHPFDLASDDEPSLFELTAAKGQAAKLTLKSGQTLRQKLNLHAPERGASTLPFKVVIDDVELRRPLRFRNLPGINATRKPLVFAGRAEPDLSSIATDERGGDLSFEAYFLWTPKVVPQEHRGVLIRIGDATGTLFDESFMKYQISEMNRLRQITAEIFVRKGLDPALNIDRESFNYSHPHYQYLMKWVHHALRQIANTQKALGEGIQKEEGKAYAEERLRSLHETVTKELASGKDDIPEVVFVTGKSRDQATTAQEELFKERKKGTLAFDSKEIFGVFESPRPGPIGKKPRQKKPKNDPKTEKAFFEEQIKAVARILAAYGCLEGMSYAKQQRLLRAIVAVFSEGKF